jgi:UDP-N-acetylglucosamine 2-epimerase
MKMARAAGLKIGHVEAGLRSFCMWHPFPEELIRVYCMKRCDILFAPSEEAQSNLEAMNVRGCVIKVKGNTIVDALRLMEKVPATIKMPDGPFALATCHRLETITSRKRLEQVVSLLNRVSRQIKVVFVTHKPTRQYLKRFSLADKLNPEICVLDMQDYMNFTALLRSAKMVLADGGSIQEECAYLNKPCLILRKKTERPDGLGRNAMLWNFDQCTAEEFYEKFKAFTMSRPEEWPRPSAQIVEVLLERERR